jgi:hypothetical protein
MPIGRRIGLKELSGQKVQKISEVHDPAPHTVVYEIVGYYPSRGRLVGGMTMVCEHQQFSNPNCIVGQAATKAADWSLVSHRFYACRRVGAGRELLLSASHPLFISVFFPLFVVLRSPIECWFGIQGYPRDQNASATRMSRNVGL